MTARTITVQAHEAAFAAGRREAAAAAARRATVNALTVCNACDVEQQHAGCSMGYCTGCCPAGGNH